jgi:Tfp pilus assembly PilM family ATPase
VLEWGGGKLAAAVARELHLTVAEAKQVLAGLSFEGTSSANVEADRRSERAREAVTAELQVLARELVASLEYYQGQEGSLAIAELLLSGGTSRIPGLAAELERLTQVRVRPVDPFARVERDESLAQRDDLASLAVAIGLGVED